MNLKKESTHCSDCGVEWLADKSNKQKKRALCKVCFLKHSRSYQKEYNKTNEMPIYVKYSDYKMDNRRAENRELSKRMMSYERREEWQEAIRLRLEEIIQDTGLWEFICRDMEKYKKRKKHIQTKHTTIDNYEHI